MLLSLTSLAFVDSVKGRLHKLNGHPHIQWLFANIS